MFNSLRIRLTLIFVGLTIVPLVVVGLLITQRGHDALQARSVAFQGEVAERVADSLEYFFNERRTELFALTNIYGIDSLDNDAQRDVLLTLLSQQPAYYQVAMVNADANETIRITRGEVITDNDLVNRTNDPVVQSAMETGQVQFGSVYFNESARDRFITIAVPIENLYTGGVENVLVAEVRFQNVSDAILRETNLGEGEDIFVINSDGVVLAHRNPNLVIRETAFPVPESDGRTAGLNDDDVVLATHPVQLAGQELFVVAQTSYKNATAIANDLSTISRFITLTTLLISGIVVVWTVSRVVNPIINMARVATAVEQGDLNVKANEKGKGEIAVLGRAFNQMTAQLQKTLDGLQHNVTELEASNKEREVLIKDLQAAKRIAEENSRLKSEFLSTMSHELRTPMNAIEGFTGIMLKRMAGVDYNDKAERYLHKIQSNSRRLLGLINDFLDLSRIESGRLELAYMPMSPTEMAQKWRDNLSVLADEKGLEFEVIVDPDLPEKMYGDEESLSKIAINLVGNAIKFTEEGRIKLSLQKRGDQMELEVEDTGIGIPAHARDFIFDEFRQVDQSSKRVHGGTGLGLAIVQKLAREMGGTVTVQSQVGVGSTFTVLVPIHIEEEQIVYGVS